MNIDLNTESFAFFDSSRVETTERCHKKIFIVEIKRQLQLLDSMIMQRLKILFTWAKTQSKRLTFFV